MQRPYPFFILWICACFVLACGGSPSAPVSRDEGKGGAGSPSIGGSSARGGSAGTQTGGTSGLAGAESAFGGGLSGAGSGGTGESGTAGSSGAPPVMVCTPQATQCSNGSFQTCKSDGSGWASQTCDFLCSAQTGCGGSCVPGSKQCSGTASQTCDTSGKWITSTTCPFVCGGAGVCGGSCVPASQQCSDNDAQLCDSTGTWTTTQTCGLTCNFANNQASCGGACVNGTQQCSGKVPQTCAASEWASGTQCPYICTNGTCGGECVPGTQKCGPQGGIQTCSPPSVWLGEGNICPFTCTNGACSGVCVPNAACPDDGNACTNDVCNAQGTACLHPNKMDGSACGSSSSTVCDSPDSCQAGACQPNPKAVNTACTDDGNTCTTDICDGAGACTHPAAPAATVCRAAGCSTGTVASQAVCGGATSCPASTTTSCYGSCDPGGLVCQYSAPVKVDDNLGAPLATDNDALYVYASVRSLAGVAQIIQYAKSNGAKTVLYQTSNSTDWIYSLIVAGNYVYFGETFWNPTLISGQVSRISTTGALQTPTYVSNQATVGFAKNSTRVYWNDGTRAPCFCTTPSHHVYSVAIGDTVATTFPLAFNGVETVPDIEVTDTSLYMWTMQPNGDPLVYAPVLMRYSLSDPINTYASLIPGYYAKPGNVLVSTTGNTAGLTKNGQYVFANVNSASDYVAFFSFKIADDTKTLLATAYSFVLSMGVSMGAGSNFVADADYLYFNDVRIPAGGGSLAYWTNHELVYDTLSMDATSLYFGSWGYWNSQPYDSIPDVTLAALFKVVK